MGDAAVYAKLIVEAVAASAVIFAVVLFLRDRKAARADDTQSRQNGLSDRDKERQVLSTIVTNHIKHAAQSQDRLAGTLDQLGERVDHFAEVVGGCKHNRNGRDSPKPT